MDTLDPGFLTEHRQMLMAIMAALSVFGVAVLAAWPYVEQDDLTRRLKEQVSGGAKERIKRREAKANPENSAQQSAGLRGKQSRALTNLVKVFHVTDRLNDGRMVQMLQQAGYRGRGAALQYMGLRIVSPIVLFGASLLFAFVLMPSYQALYIKALIVVGGTVLGFFLPPLLLKNRIDKRKLQIGRAWPDAVDLLLICVETGMSIEHAFKKVAEEMAGTSIELAKEMQLTTAELSYLKERRQAYENMARRIDLEAVQAVTSCLIQSERYGTSLGVSLRVLAQESREMRMAAAEKKAAALPPKLTVPMILFFLPVLFAVIITPAVLQLMGT